MAATDYRDVSQEVEALGVGQQEDVMPLLGGVGNPWDTYFNVPLGGRYFKTDGTWYYKTGTGDLSGDWTEITGGGGSGLDCTYYDEEDGESSTNSPTYQTRASITVPAGTWVIWASAAMFNDDDGWDLRLRDVTNNVTYWTAIDKDQDDYTRDGVATIKKLTVVGSTTIELQWRTRDSGSPAYIWDARLYAAECA